jgi:hypothetical protein
MHDSAPNLPKRVGARGTVMSSTCTIVCFVIKATTHRQEGLILGKNTPYVEKPSFTFVLFVFSMGTDETDASRFG